MKRKIFILFVFFAVCLQLKAQPEDTADFRWGNGYYYNLDVGESVTFNRVEVTLLKMENHYNLLQVGADTLWLKVSRRTVPGKTRGVRVFVADNKNVKSLTTDTLVHGLLNKDALVCLSDSRSPLLDPAQYAFPVSYNDGFIWGVEEDSYMFSYYGKEKSGETAFYRSYEGIGFDLHDARGKQKHWLAAIEESRVVWIETRELDSSGEVACVLLESDAQPGIYYVYNRLYEKNLAVKEGSKLVRGDIIGTAWGDESWGHLQFTVVKSDSAPAYFDCFNYVINGFPQLFELYFQQTNSYSRRFTRGRVKFSKPPAQNGNKKNTLAYEDYSGKGWKLGKWNPAEKVEWVLGQSDGNARLKKVLFEDTPAQCRNPDDFFEYEINVRTGTYRIRASVGDLYLPTWQKIEFEGVTAATKSLEPGEFDWTGERVVKVEDGKLTVRIYVDKENKQIAGLSEIVFQRAY